MKVYIVWLSNKQPINFPQLMRIIPTASGTLFLNMVSSFHILILSTENTFNNDFKWSSLLLIYFSVCSIIPWRGNHCMPSVICFGQNYWLSWRSFVFIVKSLSLALIFVCAAVSILIFHSSVKALLSTSLIYGLIYYPIFKNISFIIEVRWYKINVQTITNGNYFQGISCIRNFYVARNYEIIIM